MLATSLYLLRFFAPCSHLPSSELVPSLTLKVHPESNESLWRGWFGTKLLKNNTYSAEDYALTGKYAAESGATKAAHHFTTLLK